MGVVSTFVFTSDTENVTRTKLNSLVANLLSEFNGSIQNANIKAGAAIGTAKIAAGFATLAGNNTLAGDNTLSGDTTFSGTITDADGNDGGLVPSGCILMWSGAITAIPTGWVICDGNNSTPNLTDRFVIHADADSGGTNDVDDTGGASTHTLSEAELAAHTHGSVFISGANSGDGTGGPFAAIGDSGSAGSGDAHTNRDKYYALAFIMKS